MTTLTSSNRSHDSDFSLCIHDSIDAIKRLSDRLYMGLAKLQTQEDAAHSFPIPGGILDPIEGRVVSAHYATSHFSLGAALRHRRTGGIEPLEAALKGLRFTADCATSLHSRDPQYHWDFKNFAFEEALNSLSGIKIGDLESAHKKFKKSRTIATNWFAMRSVYWSLLYSRTKHPCYAAKSIFQLLPVLPQIHSDGSIDDFAWTSRPIQYSAYTAATLHRHKLLPHWFKDRLISRAAYFISAHVLPDGSFNYRGRGHEQIFGYAAATYCLLAALTINTTSNLCAEIARSLYLLTNRMSAYREQGGLLPLVLGDKGLPSRWGYYDYHYLSVYNAFLFAWLELTLTLWDNSPRKQDPLPRAHDLQHAPKFHIFSPSGTYIHQAACYTISMARGESRYPADAGITPHALWVQGFGMLFSCPGGPPTSRHGRKHRLGETSSNFVAPLFKPAGETEWLGPSMGKPGRLTRTGGHELTCSYKNRAIKYKRVLRLMQDSIHINDTIVFTKKLVGILAIFNFPISDTLHTRLEKNILYVTAPTEMTAMIRIENSSTPIFRSDTMTENPKGPHHCYRCSLAETKFHEKHTIVFDWSITMRY